MYSRLGENATGKNLPTVWLVQVEPHNFKRELNVQTDHFAAYPQALCEIPLQAGCPKEVCVKCGKARERLQERGELVSSGELVGKQLRSQYGSTAPKTETEKTGSAYTMHKEGGMKRGFKYENKTVGWSDCKCGAGFRSGVVLDPFCGSGTTGIVAKKLGRNFIGIELNPDYCTLSHKRLDATPTPLL
jgi:hypothetical protein